MTVVIKVLPEKLTMTVNDVDVKVLSYIPPHAPVRMRRTRAAALISNLEHPDTVSTFNLLLLQKLPVLHVSSLITTASIRSDSHRKH